MRVYLWGGVGLSLVPCFLPLSPLTQTADGRDAWRNVGVVEDDATLSTSNKRIEQVRIQRECKEDDFATMRTSDA